MCVNTASLHIPIPARDITPQAALKVCALSSSLDSTADSTLGSFPVCSGGRLGMCEKAGRLVYARPTQGSLMEWQPNKLGHDDSHCFPFGNISKSPTGVFFPGVVI